MIHFTMVVSCLGVAVLAYLMWWVNVPQLLAAHWILIPLGVVIYSLITLAERRKKDRENDLMKITESRATLELWKLAAKDEQAVALDNCLEILKREVMEVDHYEQELQCSDRPEPIFGEDELRTYCKLLKLAKEHLFRDIQKENGGSEPSEPDKKQGLCEKIQRLLAVGEAGMSSGGGKVIFEIPNVHEISIGEIGHDQLLRIAEKIKTLPKYTSVDDDHIMYLALATLVASIQGWARGMISEVSRANLYYVNNGKDTRPILNSVSAFGRICWKWTVVVLVLWLICYCSGTFQRVQG